MSNQDKRPLSAICVERDSVPKDQRKRLLALLKQGADIGESDKNGVTPLLHAVRFRSPMEVEALIERGDNVDQRSGATPLHRAVISTGAPGTAGKGAERLGEARLLIDSDVDLSIKNKLGKRPLDYVKDAEVRVLLKG